MFTFLTEELEISAFEAARVAYRTAPMGRKGVEAKLAAARVIAAELDLPLNDVAIVRECSYKIGHAVAHMATMDLEPIV